MWERNAATFLLVSRAAFGKYQCGTTLAASRTVEDEATISGDNCVEALLRAGFRIRSRSNGIAILVRGSNIVMVPDLDVLEPALLRAIVRSSGLPREELDRHLAHHPKRSGFFPRPVTSNGVTGHGTDPRTTTSTGVLVPRERAASKTSKDG